MWQYLAIAINSILAVTATWINTEKNAEGKRHSVFKAPSSAGWAIIILLILFTFVQLVTQIHGDNAENKRQLLAEQRRIRDSSSIQYLIMKSHDDSVSWERNFSLMDTANIKINQSRELINASYRMQMSVFDTAKRILNSTNNLLDPFSVEYISISLKFSFKEF